MGEKFRPLGFSFSARQISEGAFPIKEAFHILLSTAEHFSSVLHLGIVVNKYFLNMWSTTHRLLNLFQVRMIFMYK